MNSREFGTRLLVLLSTQGVITTDQATEANEGSPELPERVLVEKGWVTLQELAHVAASSFGARSAEGPVTYVPDLLSEEVQKKHWAYPVSDGEEIVMATASPGTAQDASDLAAITGKRITYLVVDRLTLHEHFRMLQRSAASPVSAAGLPAPVPTSDTVPIEIGQPFAAKEPAPVVKESLSVVPESTPAVTESTVEAPRRAAELLIGGRYRRSTMLVQGRFSTLYKGKDEQTGLAVAIRHLESFAKLNQAVGGPSDAARSQTLREGRLLSKLRHPGLPRIRKLVQNEDDIYLVGDQITGRTLKEEIEENGPLGPELVRRYFIQLLQVAKYMHSQDPPIIHRDLRAETVLSSSHGKLCLAEFGLAKMGQSGSADATSFRSSGDPHFAAPEQLMGDVSSPKNDLYSVGALAYFMASGKPPAESMKRFAGGSLMAPLPDELDDVVRDSIVQCLAPKLEERAKSAEDILARLEDTGEIRCPAMVTAANAPPEVEIEDPDATDKLPSSHPASTPESAPAKKSMWKLLFGRKKKKSPEKAPEEDTGVKDEQMATFAFADLASLDICRETCRILPEALCRTISGICIGALSDTEITVACKDPTDVFIYDQIAIATKGKFNPKLMRADQELIGHALEFVYRSDHLGPETRWTKYLDLKKLHGQELETTNEQAVITFGDEALEGPIVEAVDRLIKEAIAAEASDIHLEPYDTGMDIRYRIDGVLRKVAHHPRQEASAMVKRLKVLANMDIAQERVTQGGRISLKVGGAEFDLRVSVVPVPVGESVVMRILKKGAFTLTLADLGFSETNEALFRRILSQPHGMVLVCGPTGSGKSTTLYASLKEIQRPDRKLLTAEDPIEYQMPGIIQVQMNTKPKEEEQRVTFSKTLREFLRQDPDVILVGEIRDQETAEIGIQAALTGHLLLSTLHTNDSIGIVARLRDMDCEPFQIGSVLLGGLAQRLAQRICQSCRYEVPVPAEMVHMFTDKGIAEPKMYEGRGCRKCHQSGNKGRVGLYELLEVTPEIRAHINRGAHEEDIRATAEEQGFKDLLSDGMEKVALGQVTLGEVLRVCKTI